mmetsp:Transcript_7678/g.20088  ORF Transcript_7678/g.20088 Transcript_7678/m.20088 type:complete len:150 (+) Transcript_7678:526-975(+)
MPRDFPAKIAARPPMGSGAGDDEAQRQMRRAVTRAASGTVRGVFGSGAGWDFGSSLAGSGMLGGMQRAGTGHARSMFGGAREETARGGESTVESVLVGSVEPDQTLVRDMPESQAALLGDTNLMLVLDVVSPKTGVVGERDLAPAKRIT